jgi:hypothetical protein
MLKFGVQLEPLILMFQCLQKAEHKIRTAYGDSSTTYSSTCQVLLQGSGQGNGCGPATYVAISAIIKALEQNFSPRYTLSAMSL